MLKNAARIFARHSSTATPSTYPFSQTVKISSPPPPSNFDALRKGKGLMQYLSKSLVAPEKREMVDVLFSRNHPKRILPGSVLTVTLDQAPYTFSGVLLAMRRRGPETSFTLRNIVLRTGVEMQFFVNSPDVKKIEVVQRAGGGGGREGRRMRRAKLFYLRDSPEKMTAISAGLRG